MCSVLLEITKGALFPCKRSLPEITKTQSYCKSDDGHLVRRCLLLEGILNIKDAGTATQRCYSPYQLCNLSDQIWKRRNSLPGVVHEEHQHF